MVQSRKIALRASLLHGRAYFGFERRIVHANIMLVALVCRIFLSLKIRLVSESLHFYAEKMSTYSSQYGALV